MYWHCYLQISTLYVLSRELLEKIRNFEEAELAGKKTETRKLQPLGGGAGSELLNMVSYPYTASSLHFILDSQINVQCT